MGASTSIVPGGAGLIGDGDTESTGRPQWMTTGTPDEQSTTRLVVALRTCSITPSGYLLRWPFPNRARCSCWRFWRRIRRVKRRHEHQGRTE